MSTEDLLLIIYGGVLIASFFMMVSCGRLAIEEARVTAWKDLRHSTYFMITACLVLQSVTLIGISGIRVLDGLAGHPIAGRWPLSLTFCMLGLLSAKAGFHWAATLGRKRWQWRFFVAAMLLWTGLGSLLVLYR